MRIIIAGGRDFDNYELLESECNRILKQLSDDGLLSGRVELDIPNMEIVSGTARGGDILGERLGKEYGIKIKQFPADWDLYGKSAGYKRNEQMAIYAKEDNGVLIACWNGSSKGTSHMISLGRKHGLRVFVINY